MLVTHKAITNPIIIITIISITLLLPFTLYLSIFIYILSTPKTVAKYNN